MSGPSRHLLSLPTVICAGLFFVVPLALLLVYSFGSNDFISLDVTFGWTLENYRQVFEGIYLNAILRSLLISLGTVVGCLLIGFPVAYGISRQRGRVQTLLLVAVLVPFWTSFVVRTYSMVELLSDSGPLGDLLRAFGLAENGMGLLYGSGGVLIGMIYTYLPLMILPVFVALDRAGPGLRAAAADLGAPPRRVFRRVVFPLAVPGVVAGCLLVGIPAAGEYVVPSILGGDKTLMYGNVVSNHFLGTGDYPFGSALSMTLMAILTVILVATRIRTARLEVATR
jgi:ABC-type spermidine/putrescine transport system permease subunit I